MLNELQLLKKVVGNLETEFPRTEQVEWNGRKRRRFFNSFGKLLDPFSSIHTVLFISVHTTLSPTPIPFPTRFPTQNTITRLHTSHTQPSVVVLPNRTPPPHPTVRFPQSTTHNHIIYRLEPSRL